MSVEYISIDKYILSIDDLVARIEATKGIIAGMEASLLERSIAPDKAGILQYRIDDGQVKIEAIYQDQAAMVKSIQAMRSLMHMWLADLNTNVSGRTFRLTSNNNFY
jgi:hypothetical protein